MFYLKCIKSTYSLLGQVSEVVQPTTGNKAALTLGCALTS